MQRRASLSLLLVAAMVISGCTKKSSDAATTKGADGKAPAGAGGPGGRQAPSITLAANDVMTVKRSLVEESTPIAGDLHPIETVDVKARIEGDVEGVYVREGQRVRTGEVLARFEASEQASAQKSAEADRISARGATMFTVVRNDALELAASVPARKASGVTTGQTVYFNADGREFTGKVARVSPTIDPATRAITVYVQVPNTSGALKGGTFASGRVVGRSSTNAIAVPSAALRQGRDGLPYVYLINGKSLEQRKVTLGIVDEVSGTAEVREGLKDGDRIVVGNVGTLGAGMNVEIVGEREQRPGG